MKTKMRKLLIIMLIITLLLTSFVFFRTISFSISKDVQADYNIRVVNSQNFTHKEDKILENVVIGFDVDAVDTGEPTNATAAPSIDLGADGYVYVAGVRTEITVEKLGASSSARVRTTTFRRDGIEYWAITTGGDIFVTSVEVRDEYNAYKPTINEIDGKVAISGNITNIDYDDKYLSESQYALKVNDDTGYYYFENKTNPEEIIETSVVRKGITMEFRQGNGYGAPIQMIGDSLLSSNNLLLSKFTALTEVLVSSQDYYIGDGSVNGDEHFANKYYVKNNNEQSIYLKLRIKITNSKNHAAEAARLMLSYYDTENQKYVYNVYALANSEGKQEYVAKTKDGELYLKDINNIEQLVVFDDGVYKVKDIDQKLTGNYDEAWKCFNLEHIVKEDGYDYYEYVSATFEIKADSIISYTLSAWFEASDREHNDSIKDGSMSFEIEYELVDKN